MDILKIIKNRNSIRKYQKRPIPQKIIDKIIEAGIWGPSVPSFLRIQPWKFVVIINPFYKRKLASIIIQKSKISKAGLNIMLHSAGNIINDAYAVIVVFKSSKELGNFKKKFKGVYHNFKNLIKTAQLSAISASIQNMIIMAESLRIGSCWFDMPLLCKDEIKRFLKTSDELIAILTLGYPAEKGSRSPRKSLSETVEFIK